jgi:hypothetical protein
MAVSDSGVSVLLHGCLSSDGVKLPATAQWTSIEQAVQNECERRVRVTFGDLNAILFLYWPKEWRAPKVRQSSLNLAASQ